MRFTPHLLPSRSGNLGILLLNKPKALNALSLEMIHCMQDILKEWFSQKDGPNAILLKSNVQDAKVPSFCAGGNVKHVYESALADAKATGVPVGQGNIGLESAEFFRQEYFVNHKLATASTSSLRTAGHDKSSVVGTDPIQISFWDGIVMGGGVGISIYGKYRVATERTVFAMPETGIGLFPDVGSLYWMPRLLSANRGMAAYLALTGRRLKAEDLLYTGLATHFVPSDRLRDLESALVDASLYKTDQMGMDVKNTVTDPFAPVLLAFHEATPGNPRESSLAKDGDNISRLFGDALKGKTMEDIMSVLEEDKSDFARETESTLLKMSPTSLKITLEGLQRGAEAKSIDDDFRMEFRLAQGCLRIRNDKGTPIIPDFYEGVRAALVDKDQDPKWMPARLEDVTREYVDSFFDPVDQEWEPPVTTTTTVLDLDTSSSRL